MLMWCCVGLAIVEIISVYPLKLSNRKSILAKKQKEHSSERETNVANVLRLGFYGRQKQWAYPYVAYNSASQNI